MDEADTANPDTVIDLSRFLSAQKKDFETALSEVREGRKESHWIWFIFPQLRGIGHSSMSRYYAVENLEEAAAFLQEPVLKKNLLTICSALLDQEKEDPSDIFGWPDDLKVRSCMTLFDRAARELAAREGRADIAPEYSVFRKILDRFYEGTEDEITLEILKELEEESWS